MLNYSSTITLQITVFVIAVYMEGGSGLVMLQDVTKREISFREVFSPDIPLSRYQRDGDSLLFKCTMECSF